MTSRVIPCFYNTSDPLVKELRDLRINYSMTDSSVIKNALLEMEKLIVFRVGDIESLKLMINSIQNPTCEENAFLEKVRTILM